MVTIVSASVILIGAKSNAALPISTAAVIPLTVAHASRVAALLHSIFPKAQIRVATGENAIVVVGSPDDVSEMKGIVSGLDVRDATERIVDANTLHVESASDAARRLAILFPGDQFSAGRGNTVLAVVRPGDLPQIHSVLSALDAPLPTATPRVTNPAFVVHVVVASAAIVAKAVSRANSNASVAVAGQDLIVRAPADEVQQIKDLVAQLDRPSRDAAYPQVFHLSVVDADSVARLLRRSFPTAIIDVDSTLNALSVTGTATQLSRISDAITQLDAQAGGQGQPGSVVSGDEFDVISLRAAVPAANGGASTSANDLAQAVQAAIGGSAPDLHITVQANSTRLILSGSRRSRELARNLIERLDVADPLVELDTKVYEVDEGAQSQLGFKFPTPLLSTIYSEVVPTNSFGSTPQFLKLQPITRTPLSLGAELDFLVSTNQAKILEDPRITTFSGHTASLRAGETVNILTTTGGGTGTVATTQVQSFQTGVTLDITPVVNSDSFVTINLHPQVNSVAGTGSSGVPNIQNRDTTTTVGVHDGETLVIGGLIEDTSSKAVTKIPLLSDIPLLGQLFRDTSTTRTRNELIVTVTPHILKSEDNRAVQHLSDIRPTIAPEATLPPLEPAAQTRSAQFGIPASSPSPEPLPSTNVNPTPAAFQQSNVYTFGAPPANNYADAGQPAQIFYLQVKPTVVKQGTPVTISAITSTNVTRLSFGPSAQIQQTTLGSMGSGKWQSTFAFDTLGLQTRSGPITEIVTATTNSGSSTNLSVPFAVSGF